MAGSGKALADHQHRQDGLLAVAIVATVLETGFFAARMACRRSFRVAWTADDYLAAIAYLAVIALNGLGIAIAMATWVGLPEALVESADPDNMILFLKLQLPLAIVYICSTTISRMSIVALLIRSFVSKARRSVCWIVQAILFSSFVAFLISALATCRPFKANWSLTLKTGEHCLDAYRQRGALPTVNAITDAALIVLLLPLRKMHVSRFEKLWITLISSLSLAGLAFALTISITILSGRTLTDTLYTAAYIGIFMTLEPATYFIVACTVTFRRLPPCAMQAKESGSWGVRLAAMPTNTSQDTSRSATKRSRSIPANTSAGQDATVTADELTPRASYVDQHGATLNFHTWEHGRDQEASLPPTGPSSDESADMDLNAAAEQLSRAHNREHFTGTTVITAGATSKSRTWPKRDSGGLGLEKTDSLGQSPEVLDSKAIAVKHEFDLTMS